jgi:hypothetical protein
VAVAQRREQRTTWSRASVSVSQQCILYIFSFSLSQISSTDPRHTGHLRIYLATASMIAPWISGSSLSLPASEPKSKGAARQHNNDGRVGREETAAIQRTQRCAAQMHSPTLCGRYMAARLANAAEIENERAL